MTYYLLQLSRKWKWTCKNGFTETFRVICQSRINFVTNKEAIYKHLAGNKKMILKK